MHQRTERGFASIAQVLSFFAAGSAAIKPTPARRARYALPEDPGGISPWPGRRCCKYYLAASIMAQIGNHSFRATGITAYTAPLPCVKLTASGRGVRGTLQSDFKSQSARPHRA
jgi:hypothetical protein